MRTARLTVVLIAGMLVRSTPARPENDGASGARLHLEMAQVVALPGRGLTLAWAPDGHALAVGGHFKDHATGQRYDTRIYDVAANALVKSYDCHYFWVVATAWDDNPFLGPVIADGGGDHAVKLWNARGPGSRTCNPGQAPATDGAITTLYRINGWSTALQFSPDGRFLLGASRDRAIRLWQIAPGPHQFEVVALWWDGTAKQFLSVRWAPDGRAIAAGDRRGAVTLWSFDPEVDLWDDDAIARFAKLGFEQQPWWFQANVDLTVRPPRWQDGGHGVVWNVRFAPDGTRVAASGTDGVSVFDTDGHVIMRAPASPGMSFNGLDWSPDGRLIAAGGSDARIYLFDARSAALVDVLHGHDDVVTAVAWSPDGRTLASTAGGPLIDANLAYSVTGPDDTVRLWTWR